MTKRLRLPIRDITLSELGFSVLVLILIAVFSFFNFQKSYIRSRDVQRKNDLKHIATALAKYVYDFGSYPRSTNGMMLACGDPKNLRACVWGQDGLRDPSDASYPPYELTLPRDPLTGRGFSYVYISDTKNYQLFAALENNKESEYNATVYKRGIACGGHICNFGIGSVPLTTQLEEGK